MGKLDEYNKAISEWAEVANRIIESAQPKGIYLCLNCKTINDYWDLCESCEANDMSNDE